jgi:hypothetical protein
VVQIRSSSTLLHSNQFENINGSDIYIRMNSPWRGARAARSRNIESIGRAYRATLARRAACNNVTLR